MNISSNNWRLSLDLHGGRIKELLYKGVRVLGTYARIDGKEGNTHLCVPSFDKEGQEKYNLPFHGLVRNVQWNVTRPEPVEGEHGTGNEIRIATTTVATATYPASLKVEQTFSLENEFIHEIAVHHISGEPVPVDIGIHYYWDTPLGWRGTQINNTNIESNIKTNGVANLKQINKIVFPHATYTLTSNGFHNAVLWTSFKADEKGRKEYSQDCCCIEPVVGWPGYFGKDESLLNKGTSVSASIRLQKVV